MPSIAPPSAARRSPPATTCPARDAASFDFFRSPPSSEPGGRSSARPSHPSGAARPPRRRSRGQGAERRLCTDAAVGGAVGEGGCAESASTLHCTRHILVRLERQRGLLAGLGGAIDLLTSTRAPSPSGNRPLRPPTPRRAARRRRGVTLGRRRRDLLNVAQRPSSGPSSTCWNDVASTCSSGCCVATLRHDPSHSPPSSCETRRRHPAGATCPAPGWREDRAVDDGGRRLRDGLGRRRLVGSGLAAPEEELVDPDEEGGGDEHPEQQGAAAPQRPERQYDPRVQKERHQCEVEDQRDQVAAARGAQLACDVRVAQPRVNPSHGRLEEMRARRAAASSACPHLAISGWTATQTRA